LIFESVAPQFSYQFQNRQRCNFAANFLIDTTWFGCRFLNGQHHSFWLPISASTVAQFLLSIFKSAVRLQNLIEISVGLAYPMGELE
jgi:hypothetical protein